MTVIIALLRGVNVGGHNRIKMEGLRSLCESLDLVRPRTHIQSGNILFGTGNHNLIALAGNMEAAIETTFHVRCNVILRTAPELASVIAKNPFATRTGIEPNRLVVNFLGTSPDPGAEEKIRTLNGGPEELQLLGRELYIYFPNGISSSQIPPAAIDKALKIPATARNWNTVTKLLQIAEEWGSA